MITENLPANVDEARKEAQSALKLASNLELFKVETKDDYEFAGEQLAMLKTTLKKLKELRVSMTKPIDQAKKNIMGIFEPSVSKLETAIEHLKEVMLSYVEKKRSEIQAIAEKERQSIKDYENTVLSIAQELEEKGDKDGAQALLEAYQEPSIYLSEQIPKTKSVQTREVWSAKVVDLRLLLEAVLNGKAPQDCVCPNMVFLNKMAVTLKNSMSVPGVKAICDLTYVARSKSREEEKD